MLLSLGLGSAWGWGCVSGDRGDLLPEKTLFSLEKRGGKGGKIIACKVRSLAGGSGRAGGGMQPVPCPGFGLGHLRSLALHGCLLGRTKRITPGCKKNPQRTPRTGEKTPGRQNSCEPPCSQMQRVGLGPDPGIQEKPHPTSRKRKRTRRLGGAAMLRETTFFLPASSEAFNSQLIIILQSDRCPIDLAHSPPKNNHSPHADVTPLLPLNMMDGFATKTPNGWRGRGGSERHRAAPPAALGEGPGGTGAAPRWAEHC